MKRFSLLTLGDALQAMGDPAEVAEMRQLREQGYDMQPIIVLGAPASHSELMHWRYDELRQRMEAALIAGLLNGSLIAWGYARGSDPSARAKRIWSDRWRALQPGFEDSSATGGGLEIFGIRVSTASPPRSTGDRKWRILINETLRIISIDDHPIRLGDRYFGVFLALAKAAGDGGRYIENRVLSPGLGKDATTKAIQRIKDAFRAGGVGQRAVDALLESERGKGYRLNQTRFEIRTVAEADQD